MKSLLLPLLAALCLTAFAAERPKRGQMKGRELYSWKTDGQWLFALVPGTNRLKSADEIKQSPDRVTTLPALQERFTNLAEGEQVTWNSHFFPGFAFPDDKTFAEVMAAAKRATITLIPDRNPKR